MDGFFVALFSKSQQGKPTTSNKRKKGATFDEAEQLPNKEFLKEGGVYVGNKRSEAQGKRGSSTRREVEDMVNESGVCIEDESCVDLKVSQTSDGKLRRRRLKRQRKKDMASNQSKV